MRLLHKHPNVISLTNLWSRDEDNELYITMELMDSDLHQIIQSKQSLSEPHHQCLMKQLLQKYGDQKLAESEAVRDKFQKDASILASLRADG